MMKSKKVNSIRMPFNCPCIISDDFFIPDETTFESSEDALNKNANKYQISSNSLDGESGTDSSDDESEKSETIGFYFHKELLFEIAT